MIFKYEVIAKNESYEKNAQILIALLEAHGFVSRWTSGRALLPGGGRGSVLEMRAVGGGNVRFEINGATQFITHYL